MSLDLGNIASIGDPWFWFLLTGSSLVWVVTLGKGWLMDHHPHWAAGVGLMLHLAVLALVVFLWSESSSAEQGEPRISPSPIRCWCERGVD